jgi:hypothetical protein
MRHPRSAEGGCAVQGSALHSLQIFFQTLVASKAKSASFEALLAALLAAGHDSQVGKTAQHNIAQCIAVLCTAAGPNQTSNTVKALLSAVQGSDETASRLALFSLGEIGRCTDLSKFKQLQVWPRLLCILSLSCMSRKKGCCNGSDVALPVEGTCMINCADV